MNNTITIVGHVGQAPSSVHFGDTGNRVVKFSVAVKEYSANSDEAKTMWVDVDAWNGLGERVLETVTRGREVVIQGRLAMSTYTKEVNGEKIPLTRPFIKLTSFHLCGKKPVDSDSAPPAKRSEPKPKLAVARG